MRYLCVCARGHHVTTSPYILFSTTTYYRSTGQHVVKTSRTLRIIPIPQVTMSPIHHIPYALLLTTTGQHVIKTLRIIPVLQVTMSPPRHIFYPLAYYYLLQVTMSPPHHISYSLLLPTTGLHVNTSPKPSESYQYYRSPCPHLAIYLILYYYIQQVHRSKCRQSPKNHILQQVDMSPPRHISHSLLLPTAGLQVNTSSKPSESYHYYRSPCHHLAIS